ncbi:hypothetical protein F511_05258, partial [Dorcoceras hygrometricum]
LPETALSVTIATTVVVAAATFLGRNPKTLDAAEAPTKTCDACGGSGICSECNGEGFMLKKMSEESAEKARSMAKNMASRYTAGNELLLYDELIVDGFQKSGAIARNAPRVDPVALAVEVGN